MVQTWPPLIVPEQCIAQTKLLVTITNTFIEVKETNYR
jgi:hypothetical protein